MELFLEKVESPNIGDVAEALARYRGRLLEGLNPRAQMFDDWLVMEQQRIDRLAVAGLERLLESDEASLNGDMAIQRARALLRIDPLREDIHRTLMLLLHNEGRSTEALKQYQNCRAILERELGIPPENPGVD